MKIIAVNIRHNFGTMSIKDATRRAWLLNLTKANSCAYVIGVFKGSTRGYFKLNKASIDTIEPNRVAFALTNCNVTQRKNIDSAIKGCNLSLFVTKYI